MRMVRTPILTKDDTGGFRSRDRKLDFCACGLGEVFGGKVGSAEKIRIVASTSSIKGSKAIPLRFDARMVVRRADIESSSGLISTSSDTFKWARKALSLPTDGTPRTFFVRVEIVKP